MPARLTVFEHVDLVAVMREVARSGRQRRLVALAAAFTGDPALLVLDELDGRVVSHR